MPKPEIKRTELIAAAEELNTLLDPDPKIKTVAIKTDALIDAIKVAAALIEAGDGITEATNDLLLTLGVELPEGVEIAETEDAEQAQGEEPEVETKEISLEDLIFLAKEMNDIMKLAPAIEVAKSDLETLKAAVMENCYDGKECQIYETDEFTEDSWVTLKALGVVPVTEDGTPAPKEEKKGKGGKKEKAEKPPKKEKAPKKEKTEKAPKGPGVIKSIVAAIKDDGPITKEEILAKLVELFPDRDAEAMKKTINIQVPNRINKEQDFTIENSDKGWKVVKAAKK